MVFSRKNVLRWVLFIGVFLFQGKQASLLAAEAASSFQQEASFSLILNQRMMTLYEREKWQEIVERVPSVQQEIKESISRKDLALTYDTFHIIGQAYLNGYSYAQADPNQYPEEDLAQYTWKREEYLWESLQFFSYCKGLFPYVLSASPSIQAVVTAWLGLGQLASQQLTTAKITFKEAKELDPALDSFFDEWFKVPNDG